MRVLAYTTQGDGDFHLDRCQWQLKGRWKGRYKSLKHDREFFEGQQSSEICKALIVSNTSIFVYFLVWPHAQLLMDRTSPPGSTIVSVLDGAPPPSGS